MKFLNSRQIPVLLIPIRDQPPTIQELSRMLALYDGQVAKLFNTSGRDYKAMNLKECLKSLSEREALELLSKHGNLVKRPFLLGKRGGAVGFKEDEWQRIFQDGNS